MSDLKSTLTVSLRDQISRRARRISSEFEKMRKAIEESGSSFSLAGKVEQTGKATDAAAASMRRLKQESKEAAKAGSEFAKAQDKLEKSRQKIEKANKRFQFAAQLEHVTQGVSRFASGMRSALAAPIGAVIEFDDQMRSVSALTNNQLPGDLKRLSDAARKMGPKFGKSAIEAAQGLEFLAQMGFDAKSQIEALEPVLALAAANKMQVGEAAKIAGLTMNQFGLETKDLTRITDVLSATAIASNAGVEQLADTMRYVAPLAKEAGLSLEQTSGMAALLADSGIDASQAGTAMRAMLSRLANPAKDAQKALDKLGLDPKSIKPSDFLGSLDRVVKAMAAKDYTKDMKLKALDQIFGQEAMTAAAVLLEKKGSGALDKFIESLQNVEGTNKRVSEEMQSGIGGAARRAEAELKDLSLTIGMDLVPALSPMIKDLTKLVKEFSSWARENPGLVKGLGRAALAIAAVSTVAVPLLATIQAISTAWAGISAVSGGIGALSAGMAAKAAARGALAAEVAGAAGVAAPAAGAAAATGGGLLAGGAAIATTVAASAGAAALGYGVGHILNKAFDLENTIGSWLAGDTTAGLDRATTRGFHVGNGAAPSVPAATVGGEMTIRVEAAGDTKASVGGLKAAKGTKIDVEVNNGASTRAF